MGAAADSQGVFNTDGDGADELVGRGNGKSAYCRRGDRGGGCGPGGSAEWAEAGGCLLCGQLFPSTDYLRGRVGVPRRQVRSGRPQDVRKQDSANSAWLEHRATGARVRCIGSDPATAHGLRSYLALIDEPAQHEASTRDRMLAAIKTGLGKTPGSRMLSLGTRPADSSHWFAKQLTGAGVAYAQVHAAGDDDPPFAVRTWRKANPSLCHLPSLRAKLAEEAASARHSPELLAAFRALRLNMGVEDTDVAVLLDAGLWEGIEGAAPMRGEGLLGH